MTALILGLIIGFVSAIPVAGPLSAVVLNRAIRGKYAQGLWIAVGAGLSESAYTFLAFWGFGRFLAKMSFIVAITNGVAAVLLAGLGVYFFRSREMRKIQEAPKAAAREKLSFLVGVGLSGLNPSLLATWAVAAGIIHSMKLFELSLSHALLFSAGVYLGIVLWFASMIKLIQANRSYFSYKLLDRSLKIIGIFLVGLSIWMAVKIFTAGNS